MGEVVILSSHNACLEEREYLLTSAAAINPHVFGDDFDT